MSESQQIDQDNVSEFPQKDPEESSVKSILAQPNQEFMDKLRAASEKFEGLKAEGTAINEKKSALIAELEAEGINKHGFRDALKYEAKSPDQRENYDLSYQATRRALGIPVQMELFDAQIARTH